MITSTRALLLVLILGSGCGRDEVLDCLDGCDRAFPEKTRHTTEVVHVTAPGQPGTSCTVQSTTTGALISCEDGSEAEVLDGSPGSPGIPGIPGKDGEDGEPGLPGTPAVVEIIDPCGTEREDGLDEVILRLGTGELAAVYYSHSKKEAFLTILRPGQYRTTDGTGPEGKGCSFEITEDGEVLEDTHY